MRSFLRLLLPVLVLAMGLWACQDQVVTPDIQPSFAKRVKPQPAPQFEPMWMVFMPPGEDSWPFDPDDDRTLDIGSTLQVVEARPDLTDPAELEFQSDDYRLFLDFQDELDQQDSDWDPYEMWCETQLCDRTGCEDAEDFNVLQFLQNASVEEEGLRGRLHGYTYGWGFDFYTTLETAGTTEDAEYMDGQYWVDVCSMNCGAIDHGVYGPEAGESYDGYEYWRIKNAPIKVWRKPLESTKKNDPWTHRTACGLFAPGSIHRGGSYEILFAPYDEE